MGFDLTLEELIETIKKIRTPANAALIQIIMILIICVMLIVTVSDSFEKAVRYYRTEKVVLSALDCLRTNGTPFSFCAAGKTDRGFAGGFPACVFGNVSVR